MDLKGFTTLDEVGGDDIKVRNEISSFRNKPSTAAEEIDYINEMLNKLEEEQSKDNINIGEAISSNITNTESNVDKCDVNNSLYRDKNSDTEDANSIYNVKTNCDILAKSDVKFINDSMNHMTGACSSIDSSFNNLTEAKSFDNTFEEDILTQAKDETSKQSGSKTSGNLANGLLHDELSTDPCSQLNSESDVLSPNKQISDTLRVKNFDNSFSMLNVCGSSELSSNADKASSIVASSVTGHDSPSMLESRHLIREANPSLNIISGFAEELENCSAEEPPLTNILLGDINFLLADSEENLSSDECDISATLSTCIEQQKKHETHFHSHEENVDKHTRDVHTDKQTSLTGDVLVPERTDSEACTFIQSVEPDKENSSALQLEISHIKSEPVDDYFSPGEDFSFDNLFDPAEEFRIKVEPRIKEEPEIPTNEEAPLVQSFQSQNIQIKSEGSSSLPTLLVPEVRFRVEDNIVYSREQLRAALLICQSSLAPVVDMDMFKNVGMTTINVKLSNLEYMIKNKDKLVNEDAKILTVFCNNYGKSQKEWKKHFPYKQTSRKSTSKKEIKGSKKKHQENGQDLKKVRKSKSNNSSSKSFKSKKKENRDAVSSWESQSCVSETDMPPIISGLSIGKDKNFKPKAKVRHKKIKDKPQKTKAQLKDFSTLDVGFQNQYSSKAQLTSDTSDEDDDNVKKKKVKKFTKGRKPIGLIKDDVKEEENIKTTSKALFSSGSSSDDDLDVSNKGSKFQSTKKFFSSDSSDEEVEKTKKTDSLKLVISKDLSGNYVNSKIVPSKGYFTSGSSDEETENIKNTSILEPNSKGISNIPSKERSSKGYFSSGSSEEETNKSDNTVIKQAPQNSTDKNNEINRLPREVVSNESYDDNHLETKQEEKSSKGELSNSFANEFPQEESTAQCSNKKSFWSTSDEESDESCPNENDKDVSKVRLDNSLKVEECNVIQSHNASNINSEANSSVTKPQENLKINSLNKKSFWSSDDEEYNETFYNSKDKTSQGDVEKKVEVIDIQSNFDKQSNKESSITEKGLEHKISSSNDPDNKSLTLQNNSSSLTGSGNLLNKNTLNFKCFVKLPDVSKQRQYRKRVKNIFEFIKQREAKADARSAKDIDRLGIRDKKLGKYEKGTSKLRLLEEEAKRKKDEAKKKEERHAEKQRRKEEEKRLDSEKLRAEKAAEINKLFKPTSGGSFKIPKKSEHESRSPISRIPHKLSKSPVLQTKSEASRSSMISRRDERKMYTIGNVRPSPTPPVVEGWAGYKKKLEEKSKSNFRDGSSDMKTTQRPNQHNRNVKHIADRVERQDYKLVQEKDSREHNLLKNDVPTISPGLPPLNMPPIHLPPPNLLPPHRNPSPLLPPPPLHTPPPLLHTPPPPLHTPPPPLHTPPPPLHTPVPLNTPPSSKNNQYPASPSISHAKEESIGLNRIPKGPRTPPYSYPEPPIENAISHSPSEHVTSPDRNCPDSPEVGLDSPAYTDEIPSSGKTQLSTINESNPKLSEKNSNQQNTDFECKDGKITFNKPVSPFITAEAKKLLISQESAKKLDKHLELLDDFNSPAGGLSPRSDSSSINRIKPISINDTYNENQESDTLISSEIDPHQILTKDPMLKTREERKKERELVKKLQKKDRNRLYYKRKKAFNEAKKLYHSEKHESKDKKKQRFLEYEAKKRDYYDLKIYLASEDRKEKEQAKKAKEASKIEQNDDEYDPTSAPLLDLDDNFDTNENQVPDDDDEPYSPSGSPLLSREEFAVDDKIFEPTKVEAKSSVHKNECIIEAHTLPGSPLLDKKECAINEERSIPKIPDANSSFKTSFFNDEKDLQNMVSSISSIMNKMKEGRPSESISTIPPNQSSGSLDELVIKGSSKPLLTIDLEQKSNIHKDCEVLDDPKLCEPVQIDSPLPAVITSPFLQSSESPPPPPLPTSSNEVLPPLPPPSHERTHSLPLLPPPPPPMFAIQKLMNPSLRALETDSKNIPKNVSESCIELCSDNDIKLDKTSVGVKRKSEEKESNIERNKKTKISNDISLNEENETSTIIDENYEDSDDLDFLNSFGISKDIVKESNDKGMTEMLQETNEMGMTEMLNAEGGTWNRSSQLNGILSKLMMENKENDLASMSFHDGVIKSGNKETSEVTISEIEILDDTTDQKISDLRKGDPPSKNTPKKLFSEDDLLESLAATELEVVYSNIPIAKGVSMDDVPPYYDRVPLAQPEFAKHQDLPLVGIQYVLEVLPSQNATFQTCYYICAICSKKMTQTTLIAHIKSVPHRLKFSESHCKDIYAKFGVIDLKTWTAPLVKEFTQALSKVVGNSGRQQLAVALERDMSIVLGSLKEKIAKVSQYGLHSEREGQSGEKSGRSNPINIKMPLKGSASQPKATSVNPVSGTAGDAPDAAISTAKEESGAEIIVLDATPEKEIKSMSSNVRKRNYRPGPRSRNSESRSRSRSTSPKRRKSRSPPHKSRTTLPHHRRRSRSPRNDSGRRRRSTSRSRAGSPGSRNSRRRSRSRERTKGTSEREKLIEREKPSEREKPNERDKPNEREKRMSSEERKKVVEERKLADFRQAEARLIARHKNQQEVLARNPESHPYYTREWKKFWEQRYKELEMQGMDPNRYDFKREWIGFWNDRMVELGNMDLDRKRKTLLQKFRMEDPGTPGPKIVSGNLPPGPGVNQPNVIAGNQSNNVQSFPTEGSFGNNPTNVNPNISSGDHLAWSGGRSRIDRSPSPWENDDRVPMKEVKNPSPPPQEIQPSLSDLGKNVASTEGKVYEQEYSVVGTLKILSELEDQLGSFGPAINKLLEKSIEMNENGDKPMDLFNDPDNTTLVKLAREKLSHQIVSNFLAPAVQARTQMAVERGLWLEREAEKLTKKEYLGLDIPVIAKASLGLDTVQVAQFIAQSLLNIGKSNVSEDDLQHILLAVSAAHAKLMVEHKAAINLAVQQQATPPIEGINTSTPSSTVDSSTPTKVNPATPTPVSGPIPHLTNSPVVSSATTTAQSALFPSGVAKEQSPKPKKNSTNMTTAAADSSTSNGSGGINAVKSDEEKDKLGSAENIKDKLKDADPKDMDKLTLEELMELLSNFSSLKREEQQALTAYLKKLELTDIKKVTKLRQMIQANAKATAKAKKAKVSADKSVPKPAEPSTIASNEPSVTSSGSGVATVSSSKAEIICLDESDTSKNIADRSIQDANANSVPGNIARPGGVPGIMQALEGMPGLIQGLGGMPGPMRGPGEVPGPMRGPGDMSGPMRGPGDVPGPMRGPGGIPEPVRGFGDTSAPRSTNSWENESRDIDFRIQDIDDRSGPRGGSFPRDDPFSRSEPLQNRDDRNQPPYGSQGPVGFGRDQDRFGLHDDFNRMRGGPDPRDGPLHGGPDPRDGPLRGGPDPRDGPLRGGPDPRDGPMRGGPDPRDGPLRGGPDPRDGPMRGGPDPRDGPMRSELDSRDNPMGRGGPLSRDDPMIKGPGFRDDPMMRGGPDLRDGPMRGGPDLRDGPMGTGGPGFRDDPMMRGGPGFRDDPMMRGGPDSRDGPMMRGGTDSRDGPMMRGGPDSRGGPFSREDPMMRDDPGFRDDPMRRGGPDLRGGPMRGRPDPRDDPFSKIGTSLMDRPYARERDEIERGPYQRDGGPLRGGAMGNSDFDSWGGRNEMNSGNQGSFQGGRGRGRGRGMGRGNFSDEQDRFGSRGSSNTFDRQPGPKSGGWLKW